MSQHAYLIMAHQHPEQLRMLMRCLDYKNNDIFLHIDAKYKDFDGTYIISLLRSTQQKIETAYVYR